LVSYIKHEVLNAKMFENAHFKNRLSAYYKNKKTFNKKDESIF